VPGRAWSLSEIEQLRSLALTDTKQTIAERMGRSVCGIERKTNELGILIIHRRVGGPGRRDSVARHWSRDEELRLMGLLGSATLRQISRQLGRTEIAVKKRLAHLGWAAHDETMTVSQLSRIFGLDRDTIRRYRDELGLTFRTCSPRTGRMINATGATRQDVHRIAQAIIDNPSPNHNLCVSLKRLREIQRIHGLSGADEAGTQRTRTS
jgi:hypothetical protein